MTQLHLLKAHVFALMVKLSCYNFTSKIKRSKYNKSAMAPPVISVKITHKFMSNHHGTINMYQIKIKDHCFRIRSHLILVKVPLESGKIIQN